jgi:hypothetical protein
MSASTIRQRRLSWQFAGASCRRRQQLRQPRQIVGGCREAEGPPDAIASSKLGLLLSGDHLDPTEGFFDSLADALADGVAGMARRAAIDRRRAPARILRHMRRHSAGR